MKQILVTGATGNIGREVIKYLLADGNGIDRVVAGVRNVDEGRSLLPNHPKLDFAAFDFEDARTFKKALEHITHVFLLRPPQISNVEVFKPLIAAMKAGGVSKVVFLSVQGVEKSSIIPHHKIERLIVGSGLEYIFVRPGYFMQNLTTTLYKELVDEKTITLPAGNAVFNWVDVADIAEATAMLIRQFAEHSNSAFEITGSEQLSFHQVVGIINHTLTLQLKYRPVGPLRFYFIKRHAGVPTMLTLVMIMLHFLPRFQEQPPLTDAYEKLTGKKPASLKAFCLRERKLFEDSPTA
jgi:uncharacterized protein YbjT (DUF2867 family)